MPKKKRIGAVGVDLRSLKAHSSMKRCTTCSGSNEDEWERGLGYIIFVKFSDVSGEAWFSIFNEEAETLLGCLADELAEMKAHEKGTNFRLQLDQAKWISFLIRVVVAPTEYDNVKRQKINVVAIAPVDFAGDARLLLEDISLMKSSATESRNRIELLHKVDKEYSHGTQFGFIDPAPITEAPKAEPDNAFTPSHDYSSRSQCFGLKLASPSKKQLVNYFDPSRTSLQPGHSVNPSQDPHSNNNQLRNQNYMTNQSPLANLGRWDFPPNWFSLAIKEVDEQRCSSN
ncbi:hypothetical protein L6452_44155 [Arctium lappa]|uniref:Uncharacterized protein n=1 Tax=Arctium lappa TaxID=4217 RepID=A0ACB8XFM3_ARCLA|nr:hypothetical protein L6452_44155 [Arctium lappa]